MKELLKPFCKKRINTNNIISLGLEEECIKLTDFLPDDTRLLERVYCILNDFTEQKKCTCGKPLSFQNAKRGYRATCSSCPEKFIQSGKKNKGRKRSEETKEKMKATMLERYGVENPFQSEEIKKKVYTPENNAKRTKAIQTAVQEKYGVNNVFQLEDVKDRIKKLNQERYGVDNIMQTDFMKSRFSIENSIKQLPDGVYEKISSIEWWEEHYSNSLIDIAEELNISHSCAHAWAHRLDIEINRPTISLVHTKINSFLDSLNIVYENNTRSIISPKELDIWIPDHNLAIEVNGIYWHSEISGGKEPLYHFNKTKLCLEKNIRLLQFWDYEIERSFDLISSMIRSVLKLPLIKIGARSCFCEFIDYTEASKFLNENHLQGSSTCSFYTALKSKQDNEILAVIGFIKPRYRKDCDFELARFAVKQNYSIPGGFSKLLSHFISFTNVKRIVSYSDSRYSQGNLYSKNGWCLEKINSPSYQYTKDCNILENRMKFQKHKLPKLLDNFDPNKTEWENMRDNGWDRVWDCGTKTWLLTI
jgi:hypothetical protein